jgi:hypothetical protein
MRVLATSSESYRGHGAAGTMIEAERGTRRVREAVVLTMRDGS